MEQNGHELATPEGDMNLDIQPYMFEPTEIYEMQHEEGNSSSEDSSRSGDENQEASQNRRENTYWCDCGQCQVMETHLECLCCREEEAVDDRRGELQCITEHEGFIANCLNRDVVEVSLYEFVAYEGPLDDNVPIHETYRYVAYRRYVRWIWHRLGRYMRKVLPACVVTKIRDAYPSETYTGFKYATPN